MLTTPRLTLRRYRLDDLDALVPVLGDAQSMRHYPHPFSREECRAWIERQLERYDRDGFGLWAIELTETGAFVGDCGPTVQLVDGLREVEIGWHVHPAHQNRGIATEAALACLEQAFGDLGLSRVISLVRPENAPSCRVAEKIGMRVEKLTRHGADGWAHRVYVMERAGLP